MPWRWKQPWNHNPPPQEALPEEEHAPHRRALRGCRRRGLGRRRGEPRRAGACRGRHPAPGGPSSAGGALPGRGCTGGPARSGSGGARARARAGAGGAGGEKKKTGVLFVCLGNICRSPTAEAMFTAVVQNAGREGTYGSGSLGCAENTSSGPAAVPWGGPEVQKFDICAPGAAAGPDQTATQGSSTSTAAAPAGATRPGTRAG